MNCLNYAKWLKQGKTINDTGQRVSEESEKAQRKIETPNCYPETIGLNIVGVRNISNIHRDESGTDSSSTVKEQHEEWIGEYKLQKPQEDECIWVYKNANGEVKRYIMG